ncbi:cellulose biosynthesis cyclic di-GMP-binding regulatory protein BcsB [Shigella flexneri]
MLRLPVSQGLLDGKTDVSIPALKLGAVNQLRFNFHYMNPLPGGSVENCITFQPVQNHVVIGDDSTIDFSKYYHFIAMPICVPFANASFPFAAWQTSRIDCRDAKSGRRRPGDSLLDTEGIVGAKPACRLST